MKEFVAQCVIDCTVPANNAKEVEGRLIAAFNAAYLQLGTGMEAITIDSLYSVLEDSIHEYDEEED